jgi:signal transduction histidine kinase
LAIARSIVEANHGTIVLANAAGGGALVRLQFPAASR